MFALGHRYTFVTEEEGIEAFFMSKDVNFEQAVQQAVKHTGKQSLSLTSKGNQTYQPINTEGPDPGFSGLSVRS